MEEHFSTGRIGYRREQLKNDGFKPDETGKFMVHPKTWEAYRRMGSEESERNGVIFVYAGVRRDLVLELPKQNI